MLTYKESKLSFKCTEGCGLNIYNATHGYKDNKCPLCGGILKKINLIKDTPKRGKNEKS